MDYILRVVCAYTKTRVARTKVVYKSGKAKCGTILNPVTSAMRAGYVMMIEVLLNRVGMLKAQLTM